MAKLALAPDLAHGRKIHRSKCAICHAANGEGVEARGEYAFPPLWRQDSFNWGAGMHRVDTAAGFIRANMPYALGGTLSDQESWDVALFMHSHGVQRIRVFKAVSRRLRDGHHDENCLYGRTPEELEAFFAD